MSGNESRIRVLVVDDDVEHLTMTERALSAYGFEVRTYRSSLGVSNVVRTALPDVVLMDVNIPALSGDKVLSLARNQAPASTKFILYSAADESRLRSLALTSGADGYLTKAVQGEALARKLSSIHYRGQQASAVGS
jgi:DNA-binding response OmpR family regulator